MSDVWNSTSDISLTTKYTNAIAQLLRFIDFNKKGKEMNKVPEIEQNIDYYKLVALDLFKDIVSFIERREYNDIFIEKGFIYDLIKKISTRTNKNPQFFIYSFYELVKHIEDIEKLKFTENDEELLYLTLNCLKFKNIENKAKISNVEDLGLLYE